MLKEFNVCRDPPLQAKTDYGGQEREWNGQSKIHMFFAGVPWAGADGRLNKFSPMPDDVLLMRPPRLVAWNGWGKCLPPFHVAVDIADLQSAIVTVAGVVSVTMISTSAIVKKNDVGMVGHFGKFQRTVWGGINGAFADVIVDAVAGERISWIESKRSWVGWAEITGTVTSLLVIQIGAAFAKITVERSRPDSLLAIDPVISWNDVFIVFLRIVHDGQVKLSQIVCAGELFAFVPSLFEDGRQQGDQHGQDADDGQ